ncbi:MAG: hypothetical protein EXQ63_03310 [Ilumatobacteraceae bacterium]|nr:hypothetical protein [Ilumatobacteraceae bacterium]
MIGRLQHVYLYLGIDYAAVFAPFAGGHVMLRIIAPNFYKNMIWANPTKGLVATPIAQNY